MSLLKPHGENAKWAALVVPMIEKTAHGSVASTLRLLAFGGCLSMCHLSGSELQVQGKLNLSRCSRSHGSRIDRANNLTEGAC